MENQVTNLWAVKIHCVSNGNNYNDRIEYFECKSKAQNYFNIIVTDEIESATFKFDKISHTIDADGTTNVTACEKANYAQNHIDVTMERVVLSTHNYIAYPKCKLPFPLN